MKAIAAVAIARKFTLSENAAAGLVVAALIGIMSVTGLISWASRVTPIPVVKGIQVGAGLSLCLSAGSSLLTPLGWTGEWWGDSLVWALAAALFLLFTVPFPRTPYALIVFIIGIVFSVFSPKPWNKVPSGPRIPTLHPSGDDFLKATTTASLGQLPLTLLNSIIAASALAADLLPYPTYPKAPTVTELGVSVAGINLIGCWFGAMPACHGSGGLAAQYRFGARSGASIIVLGTVKVLLAIITLWKQSSIVRLLDGFPKSLLGILVLAAGVELAKVGESVNTDARDLRLYENSREESWDGKRLKQIDDREKKERWMVMLVTIAALLAFRNDLVGFVAGMVWHWGFRAARRVEGWRERSGPWWRSRSHTRDESAGLLGGRDEEGTE